MNNINCPAGGDVALRAASPTARMTSARSRTSLRVSITFPQLSNTAAVCVYIHTQLMISSFSAEHIYCYNTGQFVCFLVPFRYTGSTVPVDMQANKILNCIMFSIK